jgi:hypothetical protein
MFGKTLRGLLEQAPDGIHKSEGKIRSSFLHTTFPIGDRLALPQLLSVEQWNVVQSFCQGHGEINECAFDNARHHSAGALNRCLPPSGVRVCGNIVMLAIALLQGFGWRRS